MATRMPTLSLLSRVTWRILLALYRRRGFRLTGRAPAARKCVLLGAPHTSNWDFVFVLGAMHELGLSPAFIGKHTLFRWPMTRFMRDMGGLSVDRGKTRNFVDQVADAFARSDELALVIAPEGSRRSDGRWRSGFYHIARTAGVPIVPAWIDNDGRRGGVGEPLWPSGDYGADLLKIAQFYRGVRPECDRFRVLEEQARELIAQSAAVAPGEGRAP